jgi:3-oxoacid CoA-transferase subunit A
MIDKKVNSVQEALQGIQNNMTIMLGGFGLCGIPENSIAEKKQQDLPVSPIMLESMILD